MTDEPAPPISVALDGLAQIDTDLAEGALGMLQNGLPEVLVARILELAPDARTWRLTLTGDMAATVSRITQRADDDPYPTERGAGHAGAITLPQTDGTFGNKVL